MPDTYASPLTGFLGGYQQGQDQQMKAAQQAAQEELQKQQALFQKQSADLLQNRFDADQKQQEKDNVYRDKALQQTGDLAAQKLADATTKWQTLEAGKNQRQQVGLEARKLIQQGKTFADVYKFGLAKALPVDDAVHLGTIAIADENIERHRHDLPPLALPSAGEIMQIMNEADPTGRATFYTPPANPQQPQLSPDLNPNATPNTILPTGTNAPTPGMPAPASSATVLPGQTAAAAIGALGGLAGAAGGQDFAGSVQPIGIVGSVDPIGANATPPVDVARSPSNVMPQGADLTPPIGASGMAPLMDQYRTASALGTLGNPGAAPPINFQPSPAGLPPAPADRSDYAQSAMQAANDGRRPDGTYPDLRVGLMSPQEVAARSTQGQGSGFHGVLPLVQGQMDKQKADIDKSRAQTELIKRRVLESQTLLNPQLADLLSRTGNRDMLAQETIEHHQVMEGLMKQNQASEALLRKAQITNLGARTEATKDKTKNKGVLDNRKYIAQDKAQAVQLLGKAVTARQKMHDEAILMDNALHLPPPDPSHFLDNNGQPSQSRYLAAKERWQKNQQIAPGMLLEMWGPDKKSGRLGELNGQIENLNATIQHERDALSVGMKDSSGHTINLSGPNLNDQTHGLATPTPAAARPQFQSVAQVGATPAVMFAGNAQSDRNRVNPNLLATVQQTAAQLGYRVEVGTAINGHSQYVSGTNNTRESQHHTGDAFDIVRISGPDGVWHNANVSDPAGRYLGATLGKAMADQGHQAIFGMVLGRGGDHTNHLHVGYSADGKGQSFLVSPTARQQAQSAPAPPTTRPAQAQAQAQTTRPAATPAPASGGRMTDAQKAQALQQLSAAAAELSRRHSAQSNKGR